MNYNRSQMTVNNKYIYMICERYCAKFIPRPILSIMS